MKPASHGYVSLAAGALALAALQSSAVAAPLSGANAQTSAPSSVLEKIDYRRCYWRGGERRCSWVRSGPRVYGYYRYGRPRPEVYRPGSTRWWRAMDYEYRGGHR